MPRPRFKFRLQPALDKAQAEERACEQAVMRARQAVKDEQAKLEAMTAEMSRLVQQRADAHENLITDRALSPPDRQAQERHVRALRQRIESRNGAVAEQRENLQWARDNLRIQQEELTRAAAKVEALDRLRDKWRRQFEANLARIEERRRDDDAILLWSRRTH